MIFSTFLFITLKFISAASTNFFPEFDDYDDNLLELDGSEKKISAECESLLVAEGSEDQSQSKNIKVSAIPACPDRFRSYSEINFEDCIRNPKKYRLKTAYFGSYFEFIRTTIKAGDLALISILKENLISGEFKIPLIKNWFVLDKLICDSSYLEIETFIEYLLLVLELTASYDQSIIITGQANSIPFSLKFETLKNSIKTRKPLQIIKNLLKHLKSQLNPSETCQIFNFASDVVDLVDFDAKAIKYRAIPNHFNIFALVLTELDPMAWFRTIDFQDEFLPAWYKLSPLFSLLLAGDKDENQSKELFNFLEDFVFDLDYANFKTLNEFIFLTNFPACINGSDASISKRTAIFRFILERFGITLGNCEEEMLSAIEHNLVALVEAFLRFDQKLLKSESSRSNAILSSLLNSFTEMAIVLVTYRGISSDELLGIWKNSCESSKKAIEWSFFIAIKDLLQIFEEFAADMDDFREEIVGNLTIHPFPQPSSFNHISTIFTPYIHLNLAWLSRIILTSYFGLSFISTRMDIDYDSAPIWRELADIVNFFLDLHVNTDAIMRHNVQFKEKF